MTWIEVILLALLCVLALACVAGLIAVERVYASFPLFNRDRLLRSPPSRSGHARGASTRRGR